MCHGQMIDAAIRKSRKERKCHVCGTTVGKGQLYERQVQKDGGDLIVWQACERCSVKNKVAWEAGSNDDACSYDPQEDFRQLVEDEGWKRTRRLLREAALKMFGSRR